MRTNTFANVKETLSGRHQIACKGSSPTRVGFGSGRSVEKYDRVFPGIFFTFGYFRVFRVFPGMSGIFGYFWVYPYILGLFSNI